MKHRAIIDKILARVVPAPKMEIKCVWSMDDVNEKEVGTIWVLFTL